MEVLFIYFAKSIVISVVFWLYYVLFLQGKEFHHYNRFYLLTSVVFSLILPLIKVNWFTIQPDNEKIYQLIHLMNGQSMEKLTATHAVWNFWYFATFVIAGISLFFIVKFGVSVFRIFRLKQKYPNEKHKDYNLIITDLEFAPFTFLKNLFWNKSIDKQTHNGQKIFMHELAHITQRHTFDRVFMQIMKAGFWFNPVFHLIHREIILIHEYLADQKAIANRDTKAFAEMLLNQHFHQSQIQGISPFFSSTIKKRLDMLTKNHKTPFSYARRIWALPLLFILTFVYLVQAKNKEIQTENEMMEHLVKNKAAMISEDKTLDDLKEISSENEMILMNESAEKVENDTLKKALRRKKRQLAKAQKELKQEAKEIKSLNKELRKKNREMNRLLSKNEANLNEREVKTKLLEINQLQNEIDEKVKHSRHKIFSLRKNKSDFNGENFTDALAKVAESAADISAYFESDEWQNQIANFELEAEKISDYFESEEWQSTVEKMEANAHKISNYFESEAWQEALEKMEDAFDFPEPPVPPTPPAPPSSPAVPVPPTPPSPPALSNSTVHADYIRVDKDGEIFMEGVRDIDLNTDENTIIYLDGRQISREELDNLDSKLVKSIHVNKSEGRNNGKVLKKETIKIKTK